MSIQQLPKDVAAQLKSSTVITSLNGVIYGLVQNSLDAGSSKISISVDYARGNCSVEDNGLGIAPDNFREDGGLGQLHHTSKYPPQPDCHGRSGEFLAALAALSLLTVTSHHRDYRSHNSLTFHNSRLVSRSMHVPPEERILSSPSGTRVVVRDLFGSMPVRVKQRALELERLGSARDFEQLVARIVSLLLPWPSDVTVTIQESAARRSIVLRASGAIDWSQNFRLTSPAIISRTSLLLAQASLLEDGEKSHWVPIGASASGISVKGCISLRPAATKRVQFITLGIQPLPNDRSSNILYEEFNRVFENSSFGIEDSTQVNAGCPVKTEGFTLKELRPKRGVDRWPMFFVHIRLDAAADPVDVDEFFDEKHANVAIIVDLLQIMAYEFLKKHHFRPRSVAALQRLKRPKSNSPGPLSRHLSPSASTRSQSLPESHRPPFKSGTHKQVTAVAPRTSTSVTGLKSKSASPFSSWTKLKPGALQDVGTKGALTSQPVPEASAQSNQVPEVSSSFPVVNSSLGLLDRSGNVLHKPFEEDEPVAACSFTKLPSSQPGCYREAVIWTDPITKIKSLIDSRTGFAVKSGNNIKGRLPKKTKESRHEPEAPKWKPLEKIQRSTIFKPTEPLIPQVIQVSDTLNQESCSAGGWEVEAREMASSVPITTVSRISKHALQKAEVLAQVDQKFILAKVVVDDDHSDFDNHPDHLLILIDQHAADERCQVEALLKTYFVPDAIRPGFLVAQSRLLDRPLHFDLSRQDGDLLIRYQRHFRHWGIDYGLLPEAAWGKHPQKATVTVRALPPAILERCRLEPRLLIDLLRKEAWKLHSNNRQGTVSFAVRDDGHWAARFHDCPEGILEMIHSRACRSAIMFNDPLTLEQCKALVSRLAECAFPFQCAHGRPSMVPLVRLSEQSSGMGLSGAAAHEHKQEQERGVLLNQLKSWARSRRSGR